MATQPRGKSPQDHKQKEGTAAEQDERQAVRDELLEDMPALIEPHELRMSDRARLDEILLDADAEGAFEDVAEGDELDPDDKRDYDRIKAFNRLAARVDQFAESIAKDPAAYSKWSGGKRHNHMFAILARYQEGVGE